MIFLMISKKWDNTLKPIKENQKNYSIIPQAIKNSLSKIISKELLSDKNLT